MLNPESPNVKSWVIKSEKIQFFKTHKAQGRYPHIIVKPRKTY